MPPESEESVAVTTYIPHHQKSEWEAHAKELEMSLSEFVRSMVQAGRRGFTKSEPESTGSPDTNPGVNMEETVLQALGDSSLTWDELVESVHSDLESKLEETLLTLQDEEKIVHRPRNGTYTLRETHGD